MRPGWYCRGPLNIKQNMVFKDGTNIGLAKGLRVVCQERFGESSIEGRRLFKYHLISFRGLYLDHIMQGEWDKSFCSTSNYHMKLCYIPLCPMMLTNCNPTVRVLCFTDHYTATLFSTSNTMSSTSPSVPDIQSLQRSGGGGQRKTLLIMAYLHLLFIEF